MCECPKAVPEDPQYEENLPHHPLYAGVGVHGTLRLDSRKRSGSGSVCLT